MIEGCHNMKDFIGYIIIIRTFSGETYYVNSYCEVPTLYTYVHPKYIKIFKTKQDAKKFMDLNIKTIQDELDFNYFYIEKVYRYENGLIDV